ncbi:MAG: hypothetical protein C5B59_01445 [Bacteroidetes bacterium]|nr:MAG: hypothetical protein C5B59_01445 [Bacteroidota bacterium]
MQENHEIEILPPNRYDWTVFYNKPFGFQKNWCRSHFHANGEEFNYRTVNILINGHYDSNAGPKITEIIKTALAEGLIAPFPQEADPLDEAA